MAVQTRARQHCRLRYSDSPVGVLCAESAAVPPAPVKGIRCGYTRDVRRVSNAIEVVRLMSAPWER